ncbi:hypothetical protein ACVHNB_05545 [Streptomyces sp. YJ-C3]
MVTKRFVAPALAGVLSVGVVSCGAKDDKGGGGGKGLTAALSGVPAKVAEQGVTYWDVAAARRLTAADRSLYRGLDGYGIIELTGQPYSGKPLKSTYGFDAKNVETAVMPNNGDGQRLTGTFDVGAVRDAMKKRGYKATDDDSGALRLRKRGQADVDVSGSARVTRFTGTVTLPLDPPGRTVADDAAYKEVVACLGDDVYEAGLYGKRPGYRKQGVTLLGIGARAQGSASTEKLCALAISQESAEKIAGKLRTKTAPGERFAGSKVTIGDGDTPVVSMTWKNSKKSGLRPGDQHRTTELPRLVLSP